MRKLRIPLIAVLVLGAIIYTLMSNKAKMEAKSRSDVNTTIPVTVTPVQKQRLADQILLTGIVAANNDVAIVSETQGRVTGINAEVGDRVKEGTVLIQVDDELKKAAFATAEVNYEKAQRDLERYKTLHNDSTVSDAQLEAARLTFKTAEAQYIVARRELSDTKITSPIAGVVTARPVDKGAMIKTNDVVANVVDISKLKVKVNVAEKDVFRMKAGDPAVISTDVYPGVSFDGEILTISDKGDAGHTYPVEISLLNSEDHPLRAGMFARVEFDAKGEASKLSVPRDAVLGTLKKPQVFVVKGNTAQLRDIVVSDEIGGQLPVLGGLQEGELVVVSGQNNLKDDAQVTILK